MSIEICGLYMRWNIEISVNFEHGPYINAHDQNNICIVRQFLLKCTYSNYFLATTSQSQEFLLLLELPSPF